MNVRVLLLLVVGFMVAGCASSAPCPNKESPAPAKVPQVPLEEGVLLERDGDEPVWRNNLYVHVFDKAEGMHYFFGYAMSDEKDQSRAKAFSNAMSNISKQIFVRLRYGTDNYTEQVLGHEASVVKDVTIERGAEITVRDYEGSIYTEKRRYNSVAFYHSWCRLEIPAAVYEELIREAQENERIRKEREKEEREKASQTPQAPSEGE